MGTMVKGLAERPARITAWNRGVLDTMRPHPTREIVAVPGPSASRRVAVVGAGPRGVEALAGAKAPLPRACQHHEEIGVAALQDLFTHA